MAKATGKTTLKGRIFRYGPIVICAILIFIGSGDILSEAHTAILVRVAHYLFPDVSLETLRRVHFIVRKAGHVTEYAILAAVSARAFVTSSRELLRRRWFWASLLLVVLYALSDEFHQSFVPTRGASLYDSLIDSCGGLIGLAIFWWWRQGANGKKTRRPQTAKATAEA